MTIGKYTYKLHVLIKSKKSTKLPKVVPKMEEVRSCHVGCAQTKSIEKKMWTNASTKFKVFNLVHLDRIKYFLNL